MKLILCNSLNHLIKIPHILSQFEPVGVDRTIVSLAYSLKVQYVTGREMSKWEHTLLSEKPVS